MDAGKPSQGGRDLGDASPVTALSATQLREAFAGAAAAIERQAAAIDAINVFPVPDGDTGTNLSFTMRAALAEASARPRETAGQFLDALARGALMGGRGNSGVILSQVFRGFAVAAAGREVLMAEDLAEALERGAEYAYRAVSQPREGTMLTVVREAAAAARSRLAGDVIETLAAAAEAAREAVERTPELLPVLKEAGVVDAGGQGVAVLLDGALRALRGEALAEGAVEPPVEASRLAAVAALQREHDGHPVGYCVEFLIRGDDLDPAAIERGLLERGESVLAVGDGGLVRAHVHVGDPEAAIALGSAHGTVFDVKVDNMDAQLHRFAEGHEGERREAGAFSIVAVARGRGLTQALYSVGVSRVVSGGQTMNPSVGDLVAAIEQCPGSAVIVLPNNKNVALAARQAAGHTAKEVAVVPTNSVPEGIAAALAAGAGASVERNVRRMTEAASQVRWAEITLAARSTSIGGRKIRAGQPIGIVQGDLTVAAETTEAAVAEAVRQMYDAGGATGRGGPSLLALYAGEGVSDGEAQALAAGLRERYPDLEVEVVRGDQPHYPYIVSLE